jgi:hypothetical protein
MEREERKERKREGRDGGLDADARASGKVEETTI